MKLNCDMGEGFGQWSMGNDEALIQHIDMANIACGFHASDPFIMDATVKLAKKNDVLIGAHPSYPDLQGFGRRAMKFSDEEIAQLITYQVGALSMICHTNGVQLGYVKPHGALYHLMMNDMNIFSIIIETLSKFPKPLALMVMAGPSNHLLQKESERVNVPLLFEAFCDRAYNDDGSLVSRDNEGAILKSETDIKKRVNELVKENIVTTITGRKLSINADTICVHGDHENALSTVKQVRMFINSL